MARMVPPAVAEHTQSRAERQLFETIRDQLPDSWIGLHSLGLVTHRTKPWAEIDFVLIGPSGVYCLEVKGGRVERTEGIWRFINKRGDLTEKREGPFDQVGSAAAALHQFLSDQDPSLADVIVGYGVAFPDTRLKVVGPDIDRSVVYDETCVTDPFVDYVNRLVSHWRERLGKSSHRLTAERSDRILELLRGDFDLRPSLRSRLRGTRTELIRLTAEQHTTLAGLDENERTLVKGGAGTGKTLLGFESASRAARAGRRVLFTCYSRRLAEELAAVAAETTLTVTHLHGFMTRVVTEAKRRQKIPDASPDDLFQVFYPRETIEGLFDLGLTGSWDLLVVDEAQDLLLPAYLDVFDALLDGGLRRGRWHMFIDANQDLFRKINAPSMERLNAAQPARYRLQVNCRNTRQIATEHLILSGAQLTAVLRADGPDVEHLWYRDRNDQVRRVSREINRLLSNGLTPAEIVVIGKQRLTNSGLSSGLREVPYTLVERKANGGIEYATVSAFKGLEADVVVLIDVDDLSSPHVREDLYVATSRARLLLIVALAESVRPEYEASAIDYGARVAHEASR